MPKVTNVQNLMIIRYSESMFCQQTLCSHCCLLILFSASSAYKTVSGVNGPLVILDQVKVRKTTDLR